MTELQTTCIRVAVTLARTEQIKTLAKLKARLRDHNFSETDIDAALSEWARRERTLNG